MDRWTTGGRGGAGGRFSLLIDSLATSGDAY